MRLVLIRHAESAHSVRRIIAGVQGCTGLTERGIEQAHQLAARLRTTQELCDCHALLTSPVLRARQTADILAGSLPSRAIEIDDDLCELQPGQADGLSWEEYAARFGTFDLDAHPSRPFAPGGESVEVFMHRVSTTQQRLATHFDGQTVVAVTHAGFVVWSVLRAFAIPRPGTGARLEPLHTAVTEWEVREQTWTLVRYNDASHLLLPDPRTDPK